MIERIPFMLMRFPKHEYFFFQEPARCRLCSFLALPPTRSMLSAKEKPASSDTALAAQSKNFDDDENLYVTLLLVCFKDCRSDPMDSGPFRLSAFTVTVTMRVANSRGESKHPASTRKAFRATQYEFESKKYGT